jgi:hypothetical protein
MLFWLLHCLHENSLQLKNQKWQRSRTESRYQGMGWWSQIHKRALQQQCRREFGFRVTSGVWAALKGDLAQEIDSSVNRPRPDGSARFFAKGSKPSRAVVFQQSIARGVGNRHEGDAALAVFADSRKPVMPQATAKVVILHRAGAPGGMVPLNTNRYEPARHLSIVAELAQLMMAELSWP